MILVSFNGNSDSQSYWRASDVLISEWTHGLISWNSYYWKCRDTMFINYWFHFLFFRPSRSDDYEVAKKRKALDLAKKQLKELLNVPMTSKLAGSLESINNAIIPQKKIKIVKKKRKVV